jgi:hypothetical protein
LAKLLNVHLLFIPPGLTKVLQPLDRCINSPFKKSLRNLFTQYLIENSHVNSESLDDARIRVIEDVNAIWNSEDNEKYQFLSKDCIRNSFLITGISSDLSGKDDYLFDGYTVVDQHLKRDSQAKINSEEKGEDEEEEDEEEEEDSEYYEAENKSDDEEKLKEK